MSFDVREEAEEVRELLANTAAADEANEAGCEGVSGSGIEYLSLDLASGV